MPGSVHHPVTSHYQIGKGLLPVPFVANRAWPPDESMGNRRSLRIFLSPVSYVSCFSSRRDIFFTSSPIVIWLPRLPIRSVHYRDYCLLYGKAIDLPRENFLEDAGIVREEGARSSAGPKLKGSKGYSRDSSYLIFTFFVVL
jgi:hypothetical protein